MIGRVLTGVAAGAVGTMALNAVTYGDMVVRGRPASEVPAQVAAHIADKVGIDLSARGEAPDGPTAQNRQSGLGALLGFAPGLGIGAAYGLVRPVLGDVSILRAGTVVGLAAMAGTDGPMTAMGIADPGAWDLNSWLSDLVPHLAYGLVTVTAYESLA